MKRVVIFTLLFVAFQAYDLAADETSARITVPGEATVDLSLRAKIDDKPQSHLWREFLAALFKHADVDASGELDVNELRSVPSTELLRHQLRGDFSNAAVIADGDEKQGGVSFDAFVQRYLRSLSLTGIDLRVVGETAIVDDRRNRSLFAGLAGSETSELTADRMLDSESLLRRFDLDCDERVTWEELSVDVHRMAMTVPRPVEASPATMLQETAAQIEMTLPDEAAGKLSLGAIGTAPAGWRWLPHASATTLDMAGETKWLRCTVVAGTGATAVDAARQDLMQQWEVDDLDGDQVLDQRERNESLIQATWNAIALTSDRNRDGRLTRVEANAYLDLITLGARSRVEAQVIDQGRPLFATLDVDGDGRLGLRELTQGWSRIEAWDRDRNGRITWEEVPRLLLLQFSRGAPRMTNATRQTKVPDSTNQAGPVWHQKMDRNRDGDISRREFLGDIKDFLRLDSNRDLLIDANEARAAK